MEQQDEKLLLHLHVLNCFVFISSVLKGEDPISIQSTKSISFLQINSNAFYISRIFRMCKWYDWHEKYRVVFLYATGLRISIFAARFFPAVFLKILSSPIWLEILCGTWNSSRKYLLNMAFGHQVWVFIIVKNLFKETRVVLLR